MPADNLHELFDVCDPDDRVLGQAPRGEVHARGLLHRAVHIWVFNSRGELLVHQRSAQKDESPLCWTSSASGHLAAGEDYATAAVRELHEELGLSGELVYLTKLPASPATANEHTVLYRVVSDAPPTPDPHEIAQVRYGTPSELAASIAATPWEYSPPFLELWNWWVSQAGR